MKTLVIYGNCQAQALAGILQHNALATSLFKVLYCASFDQPDESLRRLEQCNVAECAILWSQHDPQPFPYAAAVPPDCLTIRFPSLDFNGLWPFNCVNPYNSADPPHFPWGRFPYGDYVIVNQVQAGVSADETFRHYFEKWDAYKPNLPRLIDLETARLAARDAHCDVRMGEWILDNFRAKRLFWTINHPTASALSELIRRLLEASARVEPALLSVDADLTLREQFGGERGPLGAVSIPIHPKVASELELRWCDSREQYTVFGEIYSYENYFRAMIADSVMQRDAAPNVT